MQTLGRRTLAAGLLRRCCKSSPAFPLVPSTRCATDSKKPPLSPSLDATSPASASDELSQRDIDGSSTPASANSDHDDFWSSVKSMARTTPAYQNVASGGGKNWGGGQLHGGQAYQTPNNNNNPTGYPPSPLPSFDMSSPFHLSPHRRIEVRTFNDVLLVDIRQYYKDQSGSVKPGTKGISMTVPQYARLKATLAAVDARIREYGGDPDTLEQPR